MRRRTRSTAPQNRLGFTLVELLIVIVILGILVGLLVPAVMRAVGTAKDAAVSAEISAMSQALADFYSKNNVYPPSRIVINEGGNYSDAALSAAAPLGQRSLSYLRRLWPRLQFSTSGAVAGIPGGFYDVNGNGKNDGTYVLTGPECLVLFLGGIPQATNNGASWSVTGFSRNPLNPFQNASFTTNRTVPLFEFNNSRLASNTTNPTTSAITDSTGSYPWVFPGYLDSLGIATDDGVPPFYAYFSAYGGVGYDPDDVNFTEPDTQGTYISVGIKGGFKAPNTALATMPAGNLIASPAPNPYTNDAPIPTNASGDAVSGTKSPAWQNAQTYQIISSGRDRHFGIGGQYIANGNERLPWVVSLTGYTANSLQTQLANATVTGQTLGSDTRTCEKDNITNFSPGKLD